MPDPKIRIERRAGVYPIDTYWIAGSRYDVGPFASKAEAWSWLGEFVDCALDERAKRELKTVEGSL
jgi:hypothetical protein